MNYSIFETIIANGLSYVPFIKQPIKRLYQAFNYLLYKTNNNVEVNGDIEYVYLNHDESFFGYYDKSPENFNGEYCVFHVAKGKTSSKWSC